MRLKKLGSALVVVAALGAVLASSAFAAATTTDATWRTGAGGTALSGVAEVASGQVGATTFAWTFGGEPIEFNSTSIECEACTIENSGGTAIGKGKLKFTGLTVAKPSGCSVASTITTKALKVKADYMIGTANYVLVEPESGPETGWATIELTGEKCPIKIAIIPKGTVYVQSSNATGKYEVEPQADSSEAINSTAGGSLHVGSETATLAGSAKFKLTGTHAGEVFGTHE